VSIKGRLQFFGTEEKIGYLSEPVVDCGSEKPQIFVFHITVYHED
jgi:hypothetical protein